MADWKNYVFKDQHIDLDGNQYQGCTFRGCALVYKGGPLPILTGCAFYDCRWSFEEAATRSLQFLQGIAMMSGNAKDFIQKTFPVIFYPSQ